MSRQTREECGLAPGSEPGSCAAQCGPHAGACREKDRCEPVYRDGKATHGNADIIGCRPRDGTDRCELTTTGGAVCAYRAGMDPCRGCGRSSEGTCIARRPSVFG